MVTYQFGSSKSKPFGTSYKIAPMTTETVLNKRSCFEVDGSKDAPVTAQSVLPDLSEFTVSAKVEHASIFVTVLMMFGCFSC